MNWNEPIQFLSIIDIEKESLVFRDKWTLCTIWSHGWYGIMLGRKLHSGTFKTKESRAGLIRVPLTWKTHSVTCFPVWLIPYHVTRYWLQFSMSHFVHFLEMNQYVLFAHKPVFCPYNIRPIRTHDGVCSRFTFSRDHVPATGDLECNFQPVLRTLESLFMLFVLRHIRHHKI